MEAEDTREDIRNFYLGLIKKIKERKRNFESHPSFNRHNCYYSHNILFYF